MFLKSIYVRGVLHTLQSIFIWEVQVAVLDAETEKSELKHRYKRVSYVY